MASRKPKKLYQDLVLPTALSPVRKDNKLLWSEGQGPFFALMQGDLKGSDPEQVVGFPQISKTKLFTYYPKRDVYYIVQVNR